MARRNVGPFEFRLRTLPQVTNNWTETAWILGLKTGDQLPGKDRLKSGSQTRVKTTGRKQRNSQLVRIKASMEGRSVRRGITVNVSQK